MPRLTIRTFGGLQVFGPDQQPLPVPAKKVQALLGYLALHAGRPQPRSKLANLLWSDGGDAKARASLRQALLVLRKALALSDDELVAGPGETVEFAAACAEVDVLAFERLLDDAGDAAPEEAARIYTGELLEALETGEPAFDDWLSARRRHLHERALAALAQLLARYTDAGQLERAIEVAMRLLALDPLQETVHRSLMQLYARQGRSTSALQQFNFCRDALARELGAQPQAQTVRLRDAIERERSAPSLAAPEAAAATMELRPVAVVVAESTAIADEDDPERARALAERFATAAESVAARFAGRLDRRFDSGISVLFGVPLAHGNDVERAARCALALCGAHPGVSAGVAVGSMLVTQPRDPTTAQVAVSGEAAGIAARLAAAAAPGEVMVSEAVWRALASRAEGQAGPEAALPLTLRKLGGWRLTAVRSTALAPTRLVGRRTELDQFIASLQACRERGTGLAVHLRGEAGIGKSRLVEAFRAVAATHGFVHESGVVLDFGSGAERDPLRTLVRGLLEIEDEDAGAVAAALERAASDGRIDPAHVVHAFDLLHVPMPPALRGVFEAMDHVTREREQNAALADLLHRASERAPRLLVLEDLHWASARTLRRAATLAATTERCRAVLVTTARSAGDPLDAAWRSASGVSALVTFDLGPLRPAEANALAAQLTDAADGFTTRCIERAGGNPLFLEQLLAGSRESAGALPASVQSVVQARLDTLEHPERHAVRVASVLGQQFPLAALRNLLGGAAWNPHLAQGLVHIEANDGVFAHALVHEGAYASLPQALRRELHATAAAWFDGRDPVLRAEHLDRAGDERAAQAYLDAASVQAAAFRHELTAQLAARGLECGGATAPRAALACLRGDALHDLGATVEAQQAYEQALAAAADDVGRCRAWLGLAAVLRIRDDLAGAEAALASAEAAAIRHGLVEQQSRICFLRGNLLFPKADLAGCEREHERSLALARQARSVELEAGALGGLGDAAYLRGHLLTARERFRACVALAQEHSMKRIEAANLPMVAFARWYGGDTRAALADAQAAVAAAAQIGHRRAEAIAHHAAYHCTHALLAFDAALAHADRALLLARQINAPRFEAEALAFRGELLRCRGERKAALTELHRALEIARATGMAFMGPVFLGMLARATDEPAARSQALGEAEALLATNGLAHNHLLFRRDAIDVSLETGAWAEALRHAAALDSHTRSQRLPWSDFYVARAEALARLVTNPGNTDTREALQGLKRDGERLGLLEGIAAIDAALSGGRRGAEAHSR